MNHHKYAVHIRHTLFLVENIRKATDYFRAQCQAVLDQVLIRIKCGTVGTLYV